MTGVETRKLFVYLMYLIYQALYVGMVLAFDGVWQSASVLLLNKRASIKIIYANGVSVKTFEGFIQT